MVGIYYTESRKKAIKKYFDKLKAEGRPRTHGTNEEARARMTKIYALQYIRKLFKE